MREETHEVLRRNLRSQTRDPFSLTLALSRWERECVFQPRKYSRSAFARDTLSGACDDAGEFGLIDMDREARVDLRIKARQHCDNAASAMRESRQIMKSQNFRTLLTTLRAAVGVAVATVSALGQAPVISSLSQNGQLVCTNSLPSQEFQRHLP